MHQRKRGRVEKIGPEGVVDYFGVTPNQVIDVQALIGDSVDNVPGVPGIGAKGAAKLIQEFGTLDNIYANIENVANKRQNVSLKENRELAYLSKELVTLKTDMQIDLNLADLAVDVKYCVANQDLLNFFNEMEFKALVNKTSKLLDSHGEIPTINDLASVTNPQEKLDDLSFSESSRSQQGVFNNDHYQLANTKEKDPKSYASRSKCKHSGI